MVDGAISRRRVLEVLGAMGVGAAAGALAPPRRTDAADAPVLNQHETVQEAMTRLFGTRPLKDGTGTVKFEIPAIAENGASVPLAVEVASPMTKTNYVKTIYIVADKNRIPFVARVTFTPESGAAYAAANIRLGETTDVRVIAEQSGGALLQVSRLVKVTVGGCGG